MHESRKKLIGEINTLQSENISLDSIKDKFTPYLWIRELSRSVRWDEIGDPLPDEGEGERNESDSLGPFKIVASYFNMNHNSLNIIEYNEIFNVMTILGDGNGIYISDTGPFNIIRYNFIHSSPEAWGVGIRTDAWQMNTYVFGNIIWKFSGGIASSANNLAFNNIVASCKNTRLSEQPGKHLDFYYDYSGTKEVRFTDGLVMRNVIWHDGESLPYFRINLTEDKHVNNVVDYNFYYWKNHISEMEAMLSRLRELNIDKKGMILDPMFTDPENGNFNLAPGSPLNKYGFVPLSQDEMGLTQDFPAKFSIR